MILNLLSKHRPKDPLCAVVPAAEILSTPDRAHLGGGSQEMGQEKDDDDDYEGNSTCNRG